MIIYVIIYHIRNNKNYNIDMSIKYNTIISKTYKQYIYNYINFQRGKKKKRKECITIIAYIAIQRIYHRLFGSKQKKRKDIILYKYILINPAIREKEKEYSIYNTIKNKSSLPFGGKQKKKGDIIQLQYIVQRE